jgi:hypothetical protein
MPFALHRGFEMVAINSLETFFCETVIPLRLSCVTHSGWPIVLSLWYVYEDGFLFCATPQTARVVGYLSAESRCGYEVAADLPPYCGVRGQAIASIEKTRGIEILEKLLHRYVGGIDNPLAKSLLSRRESEVAIRLELKRMHSWNFSQRMSGLSKNRETKVCPE